MTEVLKVSIPNTLQTDFDYFPLTSCNPTIGCRVIVPFRNQKRLGIISAFGKAVTDTNKIKTIDSLLDKQPIISSEMLALCRWVSDYFQSPLSEVLALALPKKLRLGEKAELPKIEYFKLTLPLDKSLSNIKKSAKKQKEILELLNEKQLSRAQLSALGINSQNIKRLREKHLISSFEQSELEIICDKSLQEKLNLNQEQAFAVDTMSESLDNYACFLLQGVTGSGKTEVYLQVIDKILAKNRQVLVLVPEIGLTPQTVSRFEKRFNVPIVSIHSSLNETERLNAWLLAKEEQARIILGTRSAVFTPIPKLGLIVIDEEHDLSYKQMEGVRYSARETALMRAHQSNIPIILGSATPSLESLHNANKNKYQRLCLPTKAMNQNPIHFKIIDCRNKTIIDGISESLLQAIENHLSQDNQVLVFLNRRGYAPVLMCHQCGWIKDCRHCESHLTLHAKIGRMQCHHCGAASYIPKRCESCSYDELIPCGVGTQRVTDYLSLQFPNHNVLRIDRDATSRKNSLQEKLAMIESGQAQLLIGTQMLAKGHHFPNLSLVAILDIDSGFYSYDFRALERLGQLITQVSGRAGRAHKKGEVVLQTHLPDNPLLNLLVQKGYQAFASQLLQEREQANLPPFCHLALIRARSKFKNRMIDFLNLAKQMLTEHRLQTFGPAPAPLERKADSYRMQLLVKSTSRKQLAQALQTLRSNMRHSKLTNSMRWSIDIDPQDLS